MNHNVCVETAIFEHFLAVFHHFKYFCICSYCKPLMGAQLGCHQTNRCHKVKSCEPEINRRVERTVKNVFDTPSWGAGLIDRNKV